MPRWIVFPALLALLAAPMAAQAKPADRPEHHSTKFVQVRAQRHAIRVLRRQQAWQAKRTHTRAPHARKLSWNLPHLQRVNRWLRHDLARLKGLPSWVTILHPDDWACLHRYEAGSDWHMRPPQSGGPYWGGLQMDVSFMQTYGPDILRLHGGRYADTWTPHEQMVVAQRGWQARGYQPWPQTSIMCGLR